MRISILTLALCSSALASVALDQQSLPQPTPSFAAAGDLESRTQSPSRELVARHGDHLHDDTTAVTLPHSHDHAADNATSTPSHRDSSGHIHAHGPPQAVINETWILEHHAPDPLAYWKYDQEHEDAHPALLWLHVASASISFFVLLPLVIALKSGSSPFAILAQIAFLGISVLSLAFGVAYKTSTPSLYDGNSHASLGWIVMLASIAFSAADLVRVFAPSSAKQLIGSLKGSRRSSEEEGRPLVVEELQQYALSSPTKMDETEQGQHWTEVEMSSALRNTQPIRRSSTSFSDEDGTLYDSAGPGEERNKIGSLSSKIHSYAEGLSSAANVLLVVLAYVEDLSGIAVYSGSCRGSYLNGCLAHLIKGSIFFVYGLITWMRYLGLWSRFGWAWNRAPASSKAPSAEFVESFVMFLYGSTQTWMERLGHADAPYSVKDVQHISIAVMFWFGGIVGMLLESKQVRGALSTPVVVASGLEASRISPPASCSASFNPFPAIIVGTTGIAMSAHAQTFKFQVDVHALWGLLLGAFAAFRFLTYFFVWLRPPASILPSRPPTEALASLMLTCGGVVFMLSTEQVTFAAMRHGFDDLMAFLNVTVSLVSIVFAWIVVLFALQGWALGRSQSRSKGHLESRMKA